MSQAPTPQPADARLQALIADIRHFVRHRWHPLEEQIERDDEIPPAVVQELRDKGYFGWSIPQAYGGLGLSTEELVRCAFELSQASVALRARVGTNTGIGSEALVADGTEAQKQRWLPRMARGELTGCLALTEPDAGSEASNIQTTARREGDHYVLNGSKRFITNAPLADVFTVIARTGEGSTGSEGLTAFFVERSPGLVTGRPYRKMGQAGSPVSDVHFQDCRVPADQIIGGREGQGFKTVMKVLNKQRLHLAALCTGPAIRMLDLALAHAARAGMQYALASNTRDVALIAAAARRDALPDLPGMPLPAVAIVQRCADGSPYGGSGPCAGAASAPWTYVEVHASYQLGAAFVPLLPVFSQPLRLRQSAVARLQ